MTAETSLVIEKLSFRYRDRETLAIRDISFSANPGEILLIAGASGCGKTTLIRCINGLIPHSYKGEKSGRILLNGCDTSGRQLAKISQTVGTVLQDPERQILGTRVLHEVAFGLENLAMPRPEIISRVDESLRYLNITYLRDRETFNLSGGEKQKVALAGVLAMRPSILLLDEPLASLDPASAYETLDLVRRLADDRAPGRGRAAHPARTGHVHVRWGDQIPRPVERAGAGGRLPRSQTLRAGHYRAGCA